MKEIPEVEAYRFWRWTSNATKVSFEVFKKNLIKNGYVIYTVESEGTTRERKRKKNKA